jgi:CubicO group peptidase (beta-lactamase class C family)
MNKQAFLPLFALIMLVEVITVNAQDPSKQFDAIMKKEIKAGEPGAVLLVAKQGKVIYRKAFGMANMELGVPMKPEYIFRIGSITKQFTACAILKLAEEGKLSIQDDITKYIKDYPTQGNVITIEHLLTHTSGIKSYTGMVEWIADVQKKDFTPVQMIDFFKDQPMEFNPGEQWRYNNSGYFMLGYIIEVVSGKKYADYMEENFFKPLGMTSTSYDRTEKIVPNRIPGYQPTEKGFTNADFVNMSQPYSAGSLMSNIDDLYTWYKAVMAGKVINQESRLKAHTQYKLNNGKPTGYGYGWFLGNIQESPTIEHDGGINGFVSSSIYLPKEDVFVAILSNSTAHGTGEMATRIAAITIGKPYDYKSVAIPPDQLKEYTGVYESEFDGECILTVEKDTLIVKASGSGQQKALAYAKDKFYKENGFSTLEFNRDSKGALVSLLGKNRSNPVLYKKTDKPIPTQEVVTVNPDILQTYVGEYELFPNFNLVITIENGHVMTQATGQPKIEIYPESDTKFFVKVVDAKIEFVKDETGKVNKLILHQGGRDMEGKRVR